MARRPPRLKQLTLFDSLESPKPSTKPIISPPKRRSRAKRVTIVQCSEDDDSASLSGARLEAKPSAPVADDSEDEHEVFRPPAKRRRIQVVDSDSDVEQIPVKSRSNLDSRVLIDTDEEGSDEVDQRRILPSRMRTRGKKTAFQKNLEKLKMRKQGKIVDDSMSDSEQDESEEGSSTTPFKGARPPGVAISEDESSFSDDSGSFIVEDDDTAPVPQLPLVFSMESHQDISFHFKMIFQFFVHIAVLSPPDRHSYMKRQMKNEKYFYVPLNMTRRKLLGLKESLVASSVWSSAFKRTLDKYPTFEIVPLDMTVPYCDACHLGGRMSTLVGRVTGQPYDRMGFEYITDTQNSNEGDDKHEFHLGRFCARRTQVFHEFCHWEFHLFQSINQEIEQLRQSRKSNKKMFCKVAHAGGKLPPEDLTDADEICEWLDERKMIDMEWQKLKTMIDSARHLEVESKKGEKD